MCEKKIVAGLDEAGCGPAFGELVAAAVIHDDALLRENLPLGIRIVDSKMLSDKKRGSAHRFILDTCKCGVGRVSASEVDSLGLAACRRIVFHRALDDLVAKHGVRPDHLIVDGTLFKEWKKGVSHECIPKADATIPCVSAASIVAKETRDAWIRDVCTKYPDWNIRYDLVKNKGYLTPAHIQGIHLHGKTPQHRHSFRIPPLPALTKYIVASSITTNCGADPQSNTFA